MLLADSIQLGFVRIAKKLTLLGYLPVHWHHFAPCHHPYSKSLCTVTECMQSLRRWFDKERLMFDFCSDAPALGRRRLALSAKSLRSR
jgi:hypothetical protein